MVTVRADLVMASSTAEVHNLHLFCLFGNVVLVPALRSSSLQHFECTSPALQSIRCPAYCRAPRSTNCLACDISGDNDVQVEVAISADGLQLSNATAFAFSYQPTMGLLRYGAAVSNTFPRCR